MSGAGDLHQPVVGQGWALAYRKYSTDYVAEEADAKAKKLGLWRGQFVAPWDWRRRKPYLMRGRFLSGLANRRLQRLDSPGTLSIVGLGEMHVHDAPIAVFLPEDHGRTRYVIILEAQTFGRGPLPYPM